MEQLKVYYSPGLLQFQNQDSAVQMQRNFPLEVLEKDMGLHASSIL